MNNVSLIRRAYHIYVIKYWTRYRAHTARNNQSVFNLKLGRVLTRINMNTNNTLTITHALRRQGQGQYPFLLIVRYTRRLNRIRTVITIRKIPARDLRRNVADTRVVLLTGMNGHRIEMRTIGQRLSLRRLTQVLLRTTVNRTLGLTVRTGMLTLLLHLTLNISVLLNRLRRTLRRQHHHDRITLHRVILNVHSILRTSKRVRNCSSV